MRVKRYVVDSMPDALHKIRSDLGKDAVILNTKEVKVGGFLGLFGKKQIEVIAATDSQVSASPSSAVTAKQKPTISPAAASDLSSALESIAKIREQSLDLEAAPKQASTTVHAAADIYQTVSNNTSVASATSVLEKPSQQKPSTPMLDAAFVASSAAAGGKSREEAMFEDIKLMKEMVWKLSAASPGIERYPPQLAGWEQHLLDHEMEPALVEQILEHAALELSQLNAEEQTEAFAKEILRNQLRRIIYQEQHKGIAATTQIAHFVGPTGVGKTTTIAKLAAEQVLKYNRKVGFITSDTYRIAAVEQLRTYANILNLPLEVVFSPQDLTKAFQQLEDRDIIFMDTAGRNFRNEMYVSELNSLLRTKHRSETFLVLSMTSKYKDMLAITENFIKFNVDKVLFTKMDETDSYGSIFNLTHEFNLKLSYTANGQNVPDDITELDDEKLIDLMLEGYGT